MPVIATRHADIPEYVRDEQSGLLAPEKDVEALAGCIIRLVDNPDRWSEMGKAGRRHIAEQYNAETQGVRLESIYDELLRTAPAARNSDAVHRPPRAHGPGSSDNSASILL
jgi:colanic acid/amylovoran biosynthesis glycosyltransferase